MINGIRTLILKPQEPSGLQLADRLKVLGHVVVSESTNNISINPYLDSALYSFSVVASYGISEDGSYRLIFSYSVSPSFICWILAICFFPFGLLILIAPFNAKRDFEQRLNYVV